MFCSWPFLIEKTPKSEPPPSPTEHGSLTFLGSQEAPRCCPPNVFHQGTGTLIYSVVRKNWQLSNSLLPLLLPPTAIVTPPSPGSLFLLLFTDTAVLCQCMTSQAHLQSTAKHSQQRMEEGQENGFHMGCTPPPPFTSPFFSTRAEVDGHDGRTRRRRNKRIGSLSFGVKFEMRLSSFAGAGCLPTAKSALPNLSFYHLCVDRKDCSSGLFLSCSVIEEMVTGSRCWAALLPAATGLAWLWASQLPDTP